MKRILVVLAIILLSVVTKAQQQSDLQLAYSYYTNQEYEKAAYLFEDLFSKSKYQLYFIYYINCLVHSNQIDKAEKVAKSQANSAKNDLTYSILLGYVYKQKQDFSKANSIFDNVLNSLPTTKQSIIQIKDQFVNCDELEYAEKTLLKGKELVKDYDFEYELFSVYGRLRNLEKLAEHGINILETNSNYSSSVENTFQYYVNSDVNDEFYNILRSALLQRIQSSPSVKASELLCWLYVQKKNFKSAVIQAKAIDKRLNENGTRLIILGKQALEAKNYNAAVDAFEYVLKKGKENTHYQVATYGVLTAMYEQVIAGINDNNSQKDNLENQYISAFNEFGITNKNISEILKFAYLETYYYNKPDSALSTINRALSTQGISYAQKGELNLLLGDIMLYKGEIWDALMTYAKVENDNKQNEYGDDAKFRKARVAYYTGNFKWALSQLDVLKAATTKLVANDAMELSLTISDNVEREDAPVGDTTAAVAENPLSSPDLRIYARASMYKQQNLLDKALSSLDSIVDMYKMSTLVDEAYYMKAQIWQYKQEYDSAAYYFKKVADEYEYDILADKACYNYAKLSETRLSDFQSAKEYYMKILSDYPGSVYAVEARTRYRFLQEQ